MKLIFCLMIYLWPFVSTAQKVKPLTIGDKVPDITISNVYNYPSSTIRLSDLKGKLVILDFWATWCSSCISHLHKMDSLQKILKDKVQFLLVSTKTTNDTREKIEAFFKKRKMAGETLSMPVIVNDTILTRLFPHRLLPHYVWLNSNEVVSAFTEADPITAANIKTLYSKKKIVLRVKQDVMDYNSNQQLLIEGNGGNTDRLIFRSTLTQYLPGLFSGTRINKDSIDKKVCYLNMSILSLYQIALNFEENRVIVYTRDSSRYFKLNQTEPEWRNNLYCYEYSLPTKELSKRNVFTSMVHSLNDGLHLFGRMEMKKMSCYVLVHKNRISQPDKKARAAEEDKRKPAIVLKNEPLSVMLETWNDQYSLTSSKHIVIDKTGDTGNHNLKLYATMNDLAALRKELQWYGFDLIPATRELNMFVLSELNQP